MQHLSIVLSSRAILFFFSRPSQHQYRYTLPLWCPACICILHSFEVCRRAPPFLIEKKERRRKREEEESRGERQRESGSRAKKVAERASCSTIHDRRFTCCIEILGDNYLAWASRRSKKTSSHRAAAGFLTFNSCEMRPLNVSFFAFFALGYLHLHSFYALINLVRLSSFFPRSRILNISFYTRAKSVIWRC